jgi:hypothetical protein
MKWAVTLGVILFVAFLAYRTIAPVQAQCEVCLQFGDELVCRRGAGATQDEARRAAQESVCGGNASGMSAMIACRNAEPVRVECGGT